MTHSLTRRTGLVLVTALALFAWAALLSTSTWIGAPATAAAQEDDLGDTTEDDDLADATEEDDEEGGLGGLGDLAPQDDEGDEGDGTADDSAVGDDSLEDDGFDDGTGDDGLGDDGFDDGTEDATPVGGVDAGFGGLAADGTNPTAIAIAVITVLLAAAGGLWLQTRRSTADPA